MATRFDIQVRNGAVIITVGESSKTADNADGSSAPVVIGPVVISADLLGDSAGLGGNGKSSGTGSGGNGKSAGTGSGGNGKSAGTGSGGNGKSSGTGSGGSVPIVIGPIVIGGSSSGHNGASSGQEGSKAVSKNPPELGSHPLGEAATPFMMEPQQETYWCWAAVAVSIGNFFNPPNAVAGPLWSQAALATKVLASQLHPAVDCAMDPNQACDVPAKLDVALNITGNLMQDGALANQHLTFASIQNWVKAQLPVGARIVWLDGGAHFIALDGCKVTSSGERMVHVQDPSGTATTSPGFWDYDALVENYEEAGFWCDTYLVVPRAQPGTSTAGQTTPKEG